MVRVLALPVAYRSRVSPKVSEPQSLGSWLVPSVMMDKNFGRATPANGKNTKPWAGSVRAGKERIACRLARLVQAMA